MKEKKLILMDVLRNKKIYWVILILVIIGVYAYFLKESYNKKILNESEKISQYYFATCYGVKYKSWLKNLNIKQESKNPNFNYFYKMRLISFDEKLTRSEQSDKLEQLIETKYFKQQHPHNKFYTYLIIANKNISILNYDKALKYYEKAYEFIQGKDESFENERLTLEITLARMIPTGKFNYALKTIEIEKALEMKDSLGLYINYHTLAYHLLYTQPTKSMKYLEMAEKYVEADFKNGPYRSIQILKLNILARQNNWHKVDSLLQMVTDISKKNDSQIFNNNLYKDFWIEYYALAVGRREIKDFEAKLYQLKNSFEEGCKNKYYQYQIHQILANYAKLHGNEQKEIYHLNQICKYEKCGNYTSYYVDIHSDAIERLIEIYRKRGDDIETLKWYEEKEKISESEKKKIKAYNSMMEFFNKRETQYKNRKKYLHQQIIRSKNAMIIGGIIFLILMIYAYSKLLRQYRRNLNYQQKLKKNNEKILKKNKKITSHTQKTQDLIYLLEHNNKKLKKFASIAAEEIKNPIATIYQLVDYIDDKYQEKIDPEDKSMFKFLQDSSMSLNEMITNLLEYSNDSKGNFKKEELNLNSILQSIITKLNRQINEIHGEIIIDSQLPNIKGNYYLISQLFQNLISNSLKFHREGIHPVIKIGIREVKDGKAQLYLSDNGMGIPEDELQNIFELFHQVSIPKRSEGIGIGLATCKKIVLDHDGDIWADSKLNEGTTFHIEITLFDTEMVQNNETINLHYS